MTGYSGMQTMQDGMIRLETYTQWRHCITDVCGIALTLPYVEARIVALRNPADHETRRFISSWGEPHLRQVIGWFVQARQELGG